MSDKTEHIKIDCEARYSPTASLRSRERRTDDGGDEGSCAAFGYLRGIRDASPSSRIPFAVGQQHVVSVFLAWPLAV